MLPVIIPKEELERKYHVEKKSLRELCREYGHDLKTILKLFKQHGIPRRTTKESWVLRHERMLERFPIEEFQKLYFEEKMSLFDLQNRFGMYRHSIRRRLDLLGVKRRTLSESIIASFKTKPRPRFATSIERKVEQEMILRGISFEKQYGIGDICVTDFAIPSLKIAIFCDGDYWHNRPQTVYRDNWVNAHLLWLDWVVLRFWETDINVNAASVVDVIQQAITRRNVEQMGARPRKWKNFISAGEQERTLRAAGCVGSGSRSDASA